MTNQFHPYILILILMAAAYDTYDYQAYWEGREYEHDAETAAIQSFLEKIPRIDTVLEVGSGFGRLVDTYAYRAKKVVLADPSAKLLKISRELYRGKKFKFVQVSAENLPKKFSGASVDLIILVRVLHHVVEPMQVFTILNKLLVPGGHLILEFPNKKHIKITLKELFKGNFTFPIDIFPKDLRSKRSVAKRLLPFVNYHPDAILKMLADSGFLIVERRSVSNIRIPFLKRLLPQDVLISLERGLQILLAPLNFGPSIFILARKKI